MFTQKYIYFRVKLLIILNYMITGDEYLVLPSWVLLYDLEWTSSSLEFLTPGHMGRKQTLLSVKIN